MNETARSCSGIRQNSESHAIRSNRNSGEFRYENSASWRIPQRRRRGFSLTEMMVAITLLGAVGSLAMSLMVALYHNDRLLLDDLANSHAIMQWERALRDDVHAARVAQIDDERLILSLPAGEQLVYAAIPEGISRERQRDKEVVARERFSLPPKTQFTWRTEEIEGTAWVFVENAASKTQPLTPALSPEYRGEGADIQFQIRVGRSAEVAP